MLKTFAVSIDEREAIELERIVMDEDSDEALKFLKEIVRRRVIAQQTNKLQSHLDVGGDPTRAFAQRTGQMGDQREGGEK